MNHTPHALTLQPFNKKCNVFGSRYLMKRTSLKATTWYRLSGGWNWILKCMVKKFIFQNWVALICNLFCTSQPCKSAHTRLSCPATSIKYSHLSSPRVSRPNLLGTGLNISLWQYWDICSHFYTSVTVAATSTFLSNCQDTFEDTAKMYLF